MTESNTVKIDEAQTLLNTLAAKLQSGAPLTSQEAGEAQKALDLVNQTPAQRRFAALQSRCVPEHLARFAANLEMPGDAQSNAVSSLTSFSTLGAGAARYAASLKMPGEG